MKVHSLFRYALLPATVSLAPTLAWCDENCRIGLLDGIELRFVKAARVEGDSFTARFYIRNDRDSPIKLGIAKSGGKVELLGPNFEYQFPDVNGSWVTLVGPPGTFAAEGGLVVGSGEALEFQSQLPSAETFALAGGRARLIIQLLDPLLCVASHPFRAVMVRPKVAGFASE